MKLFSRLVLPLVLAAGCFLPARAATKPNILFLFTDDQRADTIGALGNRQIHTPNLDRLVRAGTTFTRAYCMGARQGAVCVPSRGMLMSGRTLFRLKENLDGQGTWPEAFGQAGYRTFITGKWHNGGPSALRSFQEGRAVFLGGMGDPLALPVQDIGPDGKFTAPRVEAMHSVAQFADAAIGFLGAQKKDRPFLAYVAFNLPHDPRLASPEQHARYASAPPPPPANFLPQHPFNNGELAVRDEQLEKWPRTVEAVQRHLADYYACVSYVDEQIGRILQALRQGGQYDNTLIVFSSDHGLAIGSHGLFGKQNLYDHSMRAPLIFAGPGIPKDQRAGAFAYLLDIFPTLGELAGVPGPVGSEGRSLAGVIADTGSKVRDSVFTAYRHVQRAVRDDRWKLIVYPQVNQTQLFDLQDDPAEMHDLAADPKRAGEVRRLTALLKDWQTKLEDQQALSTDQPQPLEFDFSKVKPAAGKKSR